MRIRLFAVIFALLAAASSSSAQYCGRPVYHAPYVEQVITTVAVPILVPAFQFQYSPPCAVPQVGFATPQVPIQNPVQAQVGQQPLGMPQQQQQQQLPAQQGPSQQDHIRNLAKALLEEMSRQSSGDNGPPAVSQPNGFGNGGMNNGGVNLFPGQSQQPQQLTQEAVNLAYAATLRSCAACHTGVASKGGTIIFTQTGVLNQDAPWRSMIKEVAEGRMPRRDSQFRITPDEQQAMLQWYSAIASAVK